MTMRVYVSGKLVVVETNLVYAIPYWEARKRIREKDGVRITWEVIP